MWVKGFEERGNMLGLSGLKGGGAVLDRVEERGTTVGCEQGAGFAL